MSASKVKVTASNNSEMYQLDQKYRPQSIDEIILPKDFRREIGRASCRERV